MEPLRSLLCKGVKYVWSDDLSMAFEKVKQLIIGAPALSAFKSDCKCLITVDASLYGLCVILAQRVAGKDQSIAFASRSLKPAETRYSTIEREALACSWAVEKFKMYVWGRRFDLVTDHKPIVNILSGCSSGSVSARLLCLVSKLQEFNFCG